jgi:hypothetical protein
MAEARLGTPQEYVDLAYGDRPRPEPAAWLRRAARTALHERPCWLADLETESLRSACFPKLMIVGIPGAHEPRREQAQAVNALLTELWSNG